LYNPAWRITRYRMVKQDWI